MKTTFHVLILDGRVAAVGGFLHRQNDTAEQMRTQTHRNARTLTTVRFTTVWTVTHTVFLSPIKDTHTQLHVWLSTTPTESARLSRLRARGGGEGADSTVREDGRGEGHSEPPPLELHASERRAAVRDQGTAPAPHTFSCNRRHTDKRQTDSCWSDNTGHRHEVNDPQ